MPTPLGPIVDGLNVTSESLAADDLVSDALVILKIVGPDGGVRLALAWSDGMSWIERLGMVTAAHAIEMPDSSGWTEDGA